MALEQTVQAQNNPAPVGASVIKIARRLAVIHASVAFARQLLRLRGVIWALCKRELASRYVGSTGGALWTILQPLATVAVFWFVFSIGFKAQGPAGTSFIAYFLAGYAPWLFFNEVLLGSTASVVRNAHLVKKTLFPTHVLPIIQIVAAAVTHAALLVIFLIIVLMERAPPAPLLMLPQLVYYFVALCVLALGLGWLLAALQVFSRDVQQIATVILNLWFWLTPIAWTQEIMPVELRPYIALNPIYYIVEGYRDAVLYGVPVWDEPVSLTLGYWLVALLALAVGARVFRRLKPEFADVL